MIKHSALGNISAIVVLGVLTLGLSSSTAVAATGSCNDDYRTAAERNEVPVDFLCRIIEIDGGRPDVDKLARSLGAYLRTFGNDRALAAAAHHVGPALVQKYHGIPPVAGTKAYVARVLGAWSGNWRITEWIGMPIPPAQQLIVPFTQSGNSVSFAIVFTSSQAPGVRASTRYQGTISGSNLKGRWWHEPADRNTGSFELRLSADGRSFTGKSTVGSGQPFSFNGTRP